MREVKFRAWEIKGKGWIAGFNMVNFHYYFNKGLKQSLFRYSTEWEEGEYLLEQFIGLKDRNGKDIYEGDVITGNLIKYTPLSTIGEIVYNDGRTSYVNRNLGGDTDLSQINHIEVVGNIHENPELLGDSK